MIVQIIMAFCATLAFAALMNAPRSEIIACGITGSISWFFYLIAVNNNFTITFSTFIAAMLITLICRVLARVRKMPITVFLTSGIIPLVPGAFLYETMLDTITGSLNTATSNGIATFAIAGAISVGIMIVLSLPNKIIVFLSCLCSKKLLKR